MDSSNATAVGRSDDGHDLMIPYSNVDENVRDDEDTEQHKAKRNTIWHKRSVRMYRHATTKWGAALESFQPLWFAICISSGGLGTILNGPFPYQARWLVTIATILYVFELALFFLFLALLIARWIIYPHVAVRRALSDPDELGSYAIPPITLMTLAALTASQVSEGSWGGHAFTIVAYVMWWIGLAWIFLTALVVLTVLFYTGNQSDRSMTPVLFMAPVGLATAGTEAGFITIYSAHMSARLAVPQIIVGYFAVGCAFFMAIILYTIYFHRLLSAGWAVAAKRPAIFILIGPCGQLSTAFQLLGQSANAYMRFADYKPSSVRPPTYGTFWEPQTAAAIDGAGILLSLLLLGFGYLMFCFALIGVIDVFVKRQATYNLTWWAIVFPAVTLTTAWLELGSAMDSPAFRALTCALFMALLIVYLVNLGFTTWGILTGSLLFGPTQAEMEDQMVENAQAKLKKKDREKQAV